MCVFVHQYRGGVYKLFVQHTYPISLFTTKKKNISMLATLRFVPWELFPYNCSLTTVPSNISLTTVPLQNFLWMFPLQLLPCNCSFECFPCNCSLTIVPLNVSLQTVSLTTCPLQLYILTCSFFSVLKTIICTGRWEHTSNRCIWVRNWNLWFF